MRYFICVLGGIQLGIPADLTERIIPVAEMNGEERTISLSAIFNRTDLVSPYGIVLKSAVTNAIKTVLLTPKIDIDLEIPDKDVNSLPQVFSGVYSFFDKVYFNGQNMVLLLEPEKLTKLLNAERK